jgi:antitoxin component of MazEF toxin-antitoxin module
MPTQLRLTKWGNSLGLRVPKDVAARAGLTEGATPVHNRGTSGRDDTGE